MSRLARRRCAARDCGRLFVPRSPRARYCSGACRQRAFYRRYKREHGERYAAQYEQAARQMRGSPARVAGRTKRPANARRRPR